MPAGATDATAASPDVIFGRTFSQVLAAGGSEEEAQKKAKAARSLAVSKASGPNRKARRQAAREEAGAEDLRTPAVRDPEKAERARQARLQKGIEKQKKRKADRIAAAVGTLEKQDKPSVASPKKAKKSDAKGAGKKASGKGASNSVKGKGKGKGKDARSKGKARADAPSAPVPETLAAKVKAVQRRGALSDGLKWTDWLRNRHKHLSDKEFQAVRLDPEQHTVKDLKAFLAGVGEEEALEANAHVDAVPFVVAFRREQAKDAEGRGWVEWIRAQNAEMTDEEFEKVMLDPKRQTLSTLLGFLSAVTQQEITAAHVVAAAKVGIIARKDGEVQGQKWVPWVKAHVHRKLPEEQRASASTAPIRQSLDTLQLFLSGASVAASAKTLDFTKREKIVDYVQRLIKAQAEDSQGRPWADWLRGNYPDLSDEEWMSTPKDPGSHSISALKKFIEATEAHPAAMEVAMEVSGVDHVAEREEALATIKRMAARRVPIPGSWRFADWLANNKRLPQKERSTLDPALHKTDTLLRFIAAQPRDQIGFLRGRLDRRRRVKESLQHFRDVYAAADKEIAAEAARILKLVEYTLQDQRYAVQYSLASHKKGWVQAPEPKIGKEEHSLFVGSATQHLLAMDCEMVETEDELHAVARVVVCNSERKVLLDRLIKPRGAIRDLRTAISGIEPGELDDIDYTLADAQADVLALMTPQTIMCGHTLNKDLEAMKMDCPLVIDAVFLYAYEGAPYRNVGLAKMVEQVIGLSNFRGVDGKAVHDCADDTTMSMEVINHRLRLASSAPHLDPPRMIWMTPSEEMKEREQKSAAVREAMEKEWKAPTNTLVMYGIDDNPGILATICDLVKDHETKSVNLEPIDRCHPELKRSAKVVFKSYDVAYNAYQSLVALETRTDDKDRPEKQVEVTFAGDASTCRIWIRPDVKGGASKEKGKRQAPEPSEDEKSMAARRQWPGWSRAVIEELSLTQRGEMPWKRLKTLVVERRKAQGDEVKTGDDQAMGVRALAAVPEAFTNTEDEMVRLPIKFATTFGAESPAHA